MDFHRGTFRVRGDVVEVYGQDGKFLAAGHYQIGSIAVRVLSFESGVINDDYWKSMLSRALAVRVATGLADSETTNCYRLVHGEGDNLPGLVIDWYDGVCVMQAHSAGKEADCTGIGGNLRR